MDDSVSAETGGHAATPGNVSSPAAHARAEMMAVQQQTRPNQQQQFQAFIEHQAGMKNELSEKQSRASRQRSKGELKKFNGSAKEDLELWLFQIEGHFSSYAIERDSNESLFLDLMVAQSRHGRDGMVQQAQANTRCPSKNLITVQATASDSLSVQRLRVLTPALMYPICVNTLRETIEHAQGDEETRKPAVATKSASSNNRGSSTKAAAESPEVKKPKLSCSHDPEFTKNAISHICGAKGHMTPDYPVNGKLRGGYSPTGEPASHVTSPAVAASFSYETGNPRPLRKRHGFWSRAPQLASQLQFAVRDFTVLLELQLSANKFIRIPRWTTTLMVQLSCFGPYETEAFVTDFTEKCDALLDMSWLASAGFSLAFSSAIPSVSCCRVLSPLYCPPRSIGYGTSLPQLHSPAWILVGAPNDPMGAESAAHENVACLRYEFFFIISADELADLPDAFSHLGCAVARDAYFAPSEFAKPCGTASFFTRVASIGTGEALNTM
ncbi:hypothetical protein ON010_g5455 [Phytophthora cinnamomi]|nr:hypothetical protein ON010_g5455 [Phytophthora cinnamomi]